MLRLSQSLHEKGHNITIFNFHGDIYNRELKSKIAPDVKVVCATNPVGSLTRFVDSLFLKIGIDFSFRNYFIGKSLQRFLEANKPEIIHSHLFKTDVICCKVANENIPVVSTMHGDYAMYYNSISQNEKPKLLDFKNKLKFVLQQLKSIVCISKEQEIFFAQEMQSLSSTPLQLTKIYNGYTATENPEVTISRHTLNIPKDAFVFGMVARGIPAKGWEELIEAFTRLNKKNSFLVLVGGSDYVNKLQEKYKNNQQIIYSGTVTNPLEWIKLFDVGLLPSYFGSESLPTVIMEYLYCHKPVIATRIGEIPAMIEYEKQTAGLLVEIVNGRTDIDQLHEKMLKVYTDKNTYNDLKNATTKCFEQFDMDRCVKAYEEIYKQHIF